MPKEPDEPLKYPLGDELSAAVAEDLESFDLDAAEEDSDEAFRSGTDMPSSGLLSFYDRVREKVLKAVEGKGGRGGKVGEGALKAILLVPDVFILLVRLALDKDVPTSTRAMIGGALAYFVLPVDLLPEAILAGAGFMDDLVLAAAVLSQAFGGDLEPYARKHWSGPDDVRVVLQDITESAQALLGHNLYGRLRGLLSRRGINIG
ncbi:MAG TPA: DUF1232 domain-containing protein [Thermoanaerobaculia bacterium]|nr:DUF1232 domain-containing protein [Thermoanaerobaculia bacterium]